MSNKYENSLIYQINLSARYFNLLFDNYFAKLKSKASTIEYLALAVIKETKNCCQRDLAKIILKDRANTGKLATRLEEKGWIRIELNSKHNRMVKILTITEEGKKIFNEIRTTIVEPISNQVKEKIPEIQLDNMVSHLKNFRKSIEKIVKTNI